MSLEKLGRRSNAHQSWEELIARGRDNEGLSVEFMYTVNVVHRNPWTDRFIEAPSVAKALQDLPQNFGNLSVFLPASNRARAKEVAIGLAPRKFERF